MKKYLTPEGLEKLKKELNYLKTIKRQEIAKRLENCAAFGDLTENSEYFEAKEAQAFLEGRILELEELIKNAFIISKKIDKVAGKSLVQIGSTILVSSTGGKKEKFKIVGAKEASPLEGKISADSPLGKAILNQPKGTIITVYTPKGKIQYKILKIN